MRASLLSLGALMLLLSACRSQPDKSVPAAAQSAPHESAPGAAAPSAAPPPAPDKQTFGAAIRSDNAQALASVLGSPEQFQGKTLVVEGDVRRACTRKGCWMELATGPSKEEPGCRVTFKDYGFFVPIDAAGSKARVEAVLEVSALSATHVDHLEREGAHFANKKPDGTAQEVRLVANAVELWR